jgi:hypothetical protein
MRGLGREVAAGERCEAAADSRRCGGGRTRRKEGEDPPPPTWGWTCAYSAPTRLLDMPTLVKFDVVDPSTTKEVTSVKVVVISNGGAAIK